MVFSAGLQYYEMSLVHGVQTVRPGRTGPVSYLLGGVTLTGCFFIYFFVSPFTLHTSHFYALLPSLVALHGCLCWVVVITFLETA